MRISDWSSDVCSSDLLREQLALEQSAPRTEADWQCLLKTQLGDALAAVEKGLRQFAETFDHYRRLRTQLVKGFALSHAFVHADISTQLDDFFGEAALRDWPFDVRSEEHTSELQSLMRISYAVFCLTKKKTTSNSYIHKNN